MRFVPRRRCGFSMLEILVALVFVSFAFLPIYNMFRFGTRGTASNAREVEMTNYASDLINFIRERKATELGKVFKSGTETLHKDSDIIAKLNQLSKKSGAMPVIPPVTESHYNRKMSVTKYKAEYKKGLSGIFDLKSDFLNNRAQVLNYLVSVTVTYTKSGSMNQEDEVVLYTLVMD